MKLEEILNTWKKFQIEAKKDQTLTENLSTSGYSLTGPGSKFDLKLKPMSSFALDGDDKPKEKADQPVAKAATPPPAPATPKAAPATPTAPISSPPDWKDDVRADIKPVQPPEARLKADPLAELPVKVKDPKKRGKATIKKNWRDIDHEGWSEPDADLRQSSISKGRISRRYKGLKDTGFRFSEFYKAIQGPEMKDIRKILGRKDKRFGRNHAKAMRAYVAKVGSFNASRELGMDEFKLKNMFGSKKQKLDPNIKNWTRLQGGSLRVPDKFLQRATKLAVKSGVLSQDQAKAFIKSGLTYDPRTGKIAGDWAGTDSRTPFGAQAVARLAGMYATRGYNASKHRDRTRHSFSRIGSHELSDKIKYLKSKIKGGKTSATEAGEGGDYKGKWQRDFKTAKRLLKDYGSLSGWEKNTRQEDDASRESLSPRVRKMLSKMSLDQTLGTKALSIAKNPKYTLQQLIDMRKLPSLDNKSPSLVYKMRRKKALLDRAIALRQGAAAGRSRVMLPGGLIDFDVKGVLKK